MVGRRSAGSHLEHPGHAASEVVHDVAVVVLAGGRRVGDVFEVGAERLRADAVVQQQAGLGLHPVLHRAHHRPDTVLDLRLEPHHTDLPRDFVLHAQHFNLRQRKGGSVGARSPAGATNMA